MLTWLCGVRCKQQLLVLHISIVYKKKKGVHLHMKYSCSASHHHAVIIHWVFNMLLKHFPDVFYTLHWSSMNKLWLELISLCSLCLFLLQIFAIFAFSTCGSYSGMFKMSVECKNRSESDLAIEVEFEYPFRSVCHTHSHTSIH